MGWRIDVNSAGPLTPKSTQAGSIEVGYKMALVKTFRVSEKALNGPGYVEVIPETDRVLVETRKVWARA